MTASLVQEDLKGNFATTDEVLESPLAQTSSHDIDYEKEDYDFVEELDQDYICPVSQELILEPHQTSCCGHHISEQVANRLIREEKPCPMCKEEHFTAPADKFFRRKVHRLKVCCPHKKSSCEWTGDLGDLNSHSTSCAKRPWECQYCGLHTTFEEGTKHTPNCPQYPLPCPNECGIDLMPRCDAERHLLVCPLQLVECEFASIGCEVKVPRRDLARHMTENAQHHLMSATLLNLQMTRELHQKMEEKDQQIVEIKQQLAILDKKMSDIKSSLDQQTGRERGRPPEHKFSRETFNPAPGRHQPSSYLDKRAQATPFSRGTDDIRPSTIKTLTLQDFSKQQAKTKSGTWLSEDVHCRNYLFKLGIDTNGYGDARNSHLSAYLYLEPGKNDKALRWPISVKAELELVDRRYKKKHLKVSKQARFEKPAHIRNSVMLGTSTKSFPLKDLAHNTVTGTEYLKDDCLMFRLSIHLD